MLSLVGCGKGEPPPVRLNDFPNALAEAICDNIEPCCEAQDYEFFRAECRNSVLDQTIAVIAYDEIAEGLIAWDENAAGECFARILEQVDACSSPELRFYSEESCQTMQRGQQQLGSPCSYSLQCKQPSEGLAVCDEVRSSTGLTGACVAFDGRKQGQSCEWTCGTSFGFLNCDPTDTESGLGPLESGACFVDDGLTCVDRSCVPLRRAGEPCNRGLECDAALYCGEGVCRIPPGLDEPCTGFCAAGYYCPLSEFDRTSRCAPQLREGSRCEFGGECLDGYCSYTDFDTDFGRCVPDEGPGSITQDICVDPLGSFL
jgi:hypothetical protein